MRHPVYACLDFITQTHTKYYLRYYYSCLSRVQTTNLNVFCIVVTTNTEGDSDACIQVKSVIMIALIVFVATLYTHVVVSASSEECNYRLVLTNNSRTRNFLKPPDRINLKKTLVIKSIYRVRITSLAETRDESR